MQSFSRSGFVLFASIFILSACGDRHDDVVTGKGSIRAINAAPDVGVVTFLIEELPLGSLDFKEISGTANYDDLEYTFNFDLFLPGDVEATRLISQSLQVATDQEYTFVLAGGFDAPELLLWKQFGRDWADELSDADEAGTTVTVLEVSFGHVSKNLGPVDAYLEAPGTSPAFAVPRGTLDYGDFIEAEEIQSGVYQLVLTEPNNPANILFASHPVSLNAAVSDLFAIMDDGGVSTADFGVRLMGQGVGTEIIDLNTRAEFRAVHAALGTDPIDVFEGSDFAIPVISDLRFGEISPTVDLELGIRDFNVTPVGNVGVLLDQQQASISQGVLHTMYLVGLPGNMSSLIVADSQRRLANYSKLRIMQSAVRFAQTDIYLLPEGSDIGLVGPNVPSLLFGQTSGYLSVSPGAYDLTFTFPSTKTVIGGPFRLDLDGSGIYGVALVDAPDITMGDIIRLDDFLIPAP